MINNTLIATTQALPSAWEQSIRASLLEAKITLPSASPTTSTSPNTQTQDGFNLSADVKELQEKYVDRNLGLVSLGLGKLKNFTGIGRNSKKAQMALDKYAKGEASREEALKELKDYRYSQKMLQKL